MSVQEANAIAQIDLQRRAIVAVHGLGFNNHAVAANALDAGDRDGPANSRAVNISNWPVFGMYQPDAIASYNVAGETYVVTANEGDARDYDGFAEEIRVGASGYVLDPTVFPNASQLKANAALGRLTVTAVTGDTDGDFDRIHAFGGRSFSIREADGTLVWDSGSALERLNTAVGEFNSDNAENGSWDTRSDNKGPEPEGVAVGKLEGRWYAFVGLERIGGVAVFDITDPAAPRFDHYVNTRDFAGDAEAGTAGDLGPEGITFVPASKSRGGEPLLFVTNEVSGSTRAIAIRPTGS